MRHLSPKEILALHGEELEAAICRMMGRDPWAGPTFVPAIQADEVARFMLSEGFSFTLTAAPGFPPMFRAAFRRSWPFDSDADSTDPAEAVCWAALLAWSEEESP